MTMLSIAAARSIAADYLDAHRPGEVVLSSRADDEAVAFGYGYENGPLSIGEGVLLVDRRSGDVSLLGALEYLERAAERTKGPSNSDGRDGF